MLKMINVKNRRKRNVISYIAIKLIRYLSAVFNGREMESLEKKKSKSKLLFVRNLGKQNFIQINHDQNP